MFKVNHTLLMLGVSTLSLLAGVSSFSPAYPAPAQRQEPSSVSRGAATLSSKLTDDQIKTAKQEAYDEVKKSGGSDQEADAKSKAVENVLGKGFTKEAANTAGDAARDVIKSGGSPDEAQAKASGVAMVFR